MPSPNAELAEAVRVDRYTVRKDGKPAEGSWREIAERVAHAVAAGGDEPWEDDYRDMLDGMYFIPGGRILAAMGAPYSVTPYNCFVLPSPVDSRDGIIDSLRDWINIQALGGGVGINMSSLRPSGATVSGVNGTSSGPIAWMELFSVATHRVVQQGGSRRGAAMLMLDDHHPDILTFINAKRTPGLLLGANLSVAVSDALMAAVAADDEWRLHFRGVEYGVMSARELWRQITDSAWASGEPGVVFMERCNTMSNTWYFDELIATNPCAEKPMGAYGVCLLGSINLLRHVDPVGRFNWAQLEQTTALAVRFLDNIIDRAVYPLEQTETAQKTIRQLGCGTMGLADTLLQLGLRYGEAPAVEFTEQVFRSIKNAAYLSSVALAQERGAFPAYDQQQYLDGGFVRTLSPTVRDAIRRHGIRNAFLTSQAPTGSIAKLAQVWAGIEPYFDRETMITNRLGTHKWVAPDSPYLVTAQEVMPEQHIEMMAAAQRHVDSAVSKTVNAPHEQSVEDTALVYALAYERGCKSVAYYRNRSRDTQVQWEVEKSPCENGECPLPEG